MVKFIDVENITDLTTEQMGLSMRAITALRRTYRVLTLGDLINLNYQQICETKHVGRVTVDEIVRKLADFGYIPEGYKPKENGGIKMTKPNGLIIRPSKAKMFDLYSNEEVGMVVRSLLEYVTTGKRETFPKRDLNVFYEMIAEDNKPAQEN